MQYLDLPVGLVLLCSKNKLPEDGTPVPKTCRSLVLVVNCILLGAYTRRAKSRCTLYSIVLMVLLRY